MKKFVPREKLSKKARRELDAKARAVWPINPVTRCPSSSKAYDRNKARKELLNHEISEPCSSYVEDERSCSYTREHRLHLWRHKRGAQNFSTDQFTGKGGYS